MLRFVRNLVWLAVIASAAGMAWVLAQSADPLYRTQEWLSQSRFRRYNDLIVRMAEKHGIDPMLVKAVIWRESAFQPGKIGNDGERGLMQVTEGAASDWVRNLKVETFVPTDLFDPKTNVDVGTWYLAQALRRWAARDEPVPFALAEYNAGKRRVDHWLEETNMGTLATGDDLRTSISFPTTRAYISDIEERYLFYKRRGWM